MTSTCTITSIELASSYCTVMQAIVAQHRLMNIFVYILPEGSDKLVVIIYDPKMQTCRNGYSGVLANANRIQQ